MFVYRSIALVLILCLVGSLASPIGDLTADQSFGSTIWNWIKYPFTWIKSSLQKAITKHSDLYRVNLTVQCNDNFCKIVQCYQGNCKKTLCELHSAYVSEDCLIYNFILTSPVTSDLLPAEKPTKWTSSAETPLQPEHTIVPASTEKITLVQPLLLTFPVTEQPTKSETAPTQTQTDLTQTSTDETVQSENNFPEKRVASSEAPTTAIVTGEEILTQSTPISADEMPETLKSVTERLEKSVLDSSVIKEISPSKPAPETLEPFVSTVTITYGKPLNSNPIFENPKLSSSTSTNEIQMTFNPVSENLLTAVPTFKDESWLTPKPVYEKPYSSIPSSAESDETAPTFKPHNLEPFLPTLMSILFSTEHIPTQTQMPPIVLKA